MLYLFQDNLILLYLQGQSGGIDAALTLQQGKDNMNIMLFGLLPLALSTGVGANGNRSLGIGTIGGMLVGTIAILVVVPILFVIFQKWEEMIFLQRHNHE